MLKRTEENLKKNGFEVTSFATAKEAAEYLNAKIDGTSVAFGGSITVEQMGLYESLSAHNEAVWHWRPDDVASGKPLAEAQKAAIYVTSVNGVSANGEIINIDGNCNRIAATLFGHEKVYLLIGCNKIAESFEAAMDRARNIAAPMNAKRLNRKTPCVQTGKCHDCNSPERICRGLTVLWKCPTGCAYEVILIGEALGY